MSTEIELPPEADRIEGAPHPRETAILVGQSQAEAGFLQAFNSGRLHHAWLITGPKGVGKATLAWRIARFLLATPADQDDGGMFGAPPPPDTLEIDSQHPVARRIRAQSEAGLVLLRRPWDEKAKRHKQDITVEEARKLKGFFAMSAAEGGRRVVIIDSADEMNPSAANAVLKLLEEPPEGAVLLLISHQPSRLLPTIRSRCRTLRCAPLAADDMAHALAPLELEMPADTTALATLSAGSVGAAVALLLEDGVKTYARIVQLVGGAPRIDRTLAIAIAESAGGRGSAAQLEMLVQLFDLFLSRLARCGAAGPPAPEAAQGEAALMARLCPDMAAARAWADLHQTTGARLRQGLAVNLDPAAMILDMVLKINATAEQVASA